MGSPNQQQQQYFWLLDTRTLWPGRKIADAAPDALSFLPSDEQAKATKFYFLRDAKLSLGSSLLKRLFAARTVHTPWHEVRFSRLGDPKHGKPCLARSHDPQCSDAVSPKLDDADFLSPSPPVPGHTDFNVSHQAGLVALAGCANIDALFGVDIVCINERNDYRVIAQEGFDAYVDMHSEVFSDADLDAMKGPITASATPQADVGAGAAGQSTRDAKLVRFYAYWCLKEAYIKLEGEALLAPWLREIEFRNVKCPDPPSGVQMWGERVHTIEVWRAGKRVEGVRMELQAFQENYMIGTAIKTRSEEDAKEILPKYMILDPDEDIYPFAR